MCKPVDSMKKLDILTEELETLRKALRNLEANNAALEKRMETLELDVAVVDLYRNRAEEGGR